MASTNTTEIVKSTAPVLKEHGEAITKVFYKLLFKNHPEMMDIFNMTNQKKGDQPKVLANAIFQYACHIDKLALLGDAVESIAQKHTSLSISKEMYPIVGENLLKAIKEVLKDAATPEIINAWAEAYNDLAVIFITREEKIYSEREQLNGGFRNSKEFVVVDKIKESDVITSFYLKRKDKTPTPTFIPGQYTSISINIPGHEHKYTRNYSMSDCPSKKHLRISVKKEKGNPDGIVSNYLHTNINKNDSLNLTMPSGPFTLKESKKPLVLISGGVGVTPLISMYKNNFLNGNRPVIFIQCVLNSKVHAFKNEIDKYATKNTKSIIIYSDPLTLDNINNHNTFKGYLTSKILNKIDIKNESDFYFCGSKPFMINTMNILKELKVNKNQINFEFFGPSEKIAY